MEEVAKAETVAFEIIFRFDVCQILSVIHKIMDLMFFLSPAQKMSDLLGRIELCPIFVWDAGIRREISKCKGDLIQVWKVR
jgi:hypothetical protein